MSTLVAQTISNGTVSTSSANVIQGSARAWVRWNGSTSPGTISSSYNVTSVTKTGTGQFTINFTNALTDSGYSIVGSTQSPGSSAGNMTLNGVPSSASSFNVALYNSNFSSLQDSTVACLAVYR